MDQRMNGYDGYHSFYQDSGYSYGQPQGYSMDYQNGGYGYDQNQGYSMDYQYGSYGYEQQQEYPMDNQGGYHHQQWNNNHQDPYCSSSQQQASYFDEILRLKARRKELMETLEKLEEQREREENERVLSDVDEVLETPKEEEMVSSSSNTKATHEAHCEVTNQSHIEEMQLEENERFLEDFAKRLTPSNDQGCANDEGCAKDDSNEQASETLAKEKCDRSKVKENLQVLLESEDLGRFHSKIDHLRFILDNKEILGDLLQEFEAEQSSNLHMKTMFEEAPSIEKKETIRTMDVPHVEYMMFKHHLRSVVEPLEKHQPLKDVPQEENVLPTYHIPSVVGVMEEPQPSKNAKRKRRKRRKKKKKTKEKGIVPKPPLLTFTPLRFVDGKLECKVSSKGGHKPFSKVRILLSPGSKGDDWSAINEAMVKTFSMKLGDRGPLSKPKVPNG